MESSINFDCTDNYYAGEIKTYEKMKYRDYVRQLKESVERDIEYHTEAIEKEKANVAKANKWIVDLYSSLNIKVK